MGMMVNAESQKLVLFCLLFFLQCLYLHRTRGESQLSIHSGCWIFICSDDSRPPVWKANLATNNTTTSLARLDAPSIFWTVIIISVLTDAEEKKNYHPFQETLFEMGSCRYEPSHLAKPKVSKRGEHQTSITVQTSQCNLPIIILKYSSINHSPLRGKIPLRRRLTFLRWSINFNIYWLILICISPTQA